MPPKSSNDNTNFISQIKLNLDKYNACKKNFEIQLLLKCAKNIAYKFEKQIFPSLFFCSKIIENNAIFFVCFKVEAERNMHS